MRKHLKVIQRKFSVKRPTTILMNIKMIILCERLNDIMVLNNDKINITNRIEIYFINTTLKL